MSRFVSHKTELTYVNSTSTTTNNKITYSKSTIDIPDDSLITENTKASTQTRFIDTAPKDGKVLVEEQAQTFVIVSSDNALDGTVRYTVNTN